MLDGLGSCTIPFQDVRSSIKELLNQRSEEHTLVKKSEKSREGEGDEVVQTAYLAEHHKDVILNALYYRHFLRERYVDSKSALCERPLRMTRFKVEVVNFFGLRQPHEVYLVVLQLRPILFQLIKM